MRLHFFSKLFFLIFTLIIFSTEVNAGGFQLWEQDASGIGDYHSGGAAEASGAGTEYYNPAGMVNLTAPEMSFGVAYIPLHINFNGLVRADEPTQTQAASNTNNFVPNFHVVYPAFSRWAFGFGITTPFGLKTVYPTDNPISAAATTTDLKTVNLNPNIAFAVSKYFSLGVGFDALYGEATYNNMIVTDVPATLLENKLANWAYGWNAGALAFINQHLRLGISYRSPLTLNGKGTSSNDGVINHNLSGQINLPSTTIMSLYADVNERLALLFSSYYTRWQVFDDLISRGVIVNTIPTTINVRENYSNTWNFAAGLHYLFMKNLMLKLGLGYDQTPTQDGYRDVRLPDASHFALALGLHWQTCQSVGVDAGFIHFFTHVVHVNNSSSQNVNDPDAQAGIIAMLTSTNGVVNSDVNVVGVQVTWKFS